MLISLCTSLVLHATTAPITQVTVFGDQARVVRTAQAASGVVEFPPLPDSVDPQTVRVEAAGAEVRRVSLERLAPEAFRTEDGRRLLKQLDEVGAELNRLDHERSALVQQRDLLARVSPTLPQNDNVRPTPRLAPAGWAAAMQFTSTQLERLQQRLRDTERGQREAQRRREALVLEAHELGNPEARSGWQVTATLSGGPSVVTLTYAVQQARWTPAWDVQLDPDKNLVTLSLAGLVTQTSGEDWAEADVTLSTALPTTATKAPTWLTWKIGTTERFIPTPTPVAERPRPAPVPPRPIVVHEEATLVKQWLAAHAHTPPSPPAAPQPTTEAYRARPQTKPMRRPQELQSPSMPSAPAALRVAEEVEARSDDELDEVSVEMFGEGSANERSKSSSFRGSGSSDERIAGFSLAAPRSWKPPSLGPDNPFSLAGGAELAFASKQKETIPSGKGTRRVALWSQQWPVAVERTVFPALSKEAYLTAALKNPSDTTLPGGPATLSVGADPAGDARLRLMAPGESFTLPLGLDRAVKVVRNVQVVDSTEGVISKDDRSLYTVSIELVNPYQTPISLRVFDQWPLPQPNQRQLEVALVASKPTAIQEALTGKLEWRLTLKPNEKQTLTFSYQVTRPRGWRLSQTEEVVP